MFTLAVVIGDVGAGIGLKSKDAMLVTGSGKPPCLALAKDISAKGRASHERARGWSVGPARCVKCHCVTWWTFVDSRVSEPLIDIDRREEEEACQHTVAGSLSCSWLHGGVARLPSESPSTSWRGGACPNSDACEGCQRNGWSCSMGSRYNGVVSCISCK